jgi:6-phosphogluconolactonase
MREPSAARDHRLQDVLVDAPAALAEALARRVEVEAARAFELDRTFGIVLTGGSIAPAFFPRLARLELDWARVRFLWGDERAVPADHEESNFRVARELWLEPAQVPASSVRRMPADAPDLALAAAAYAAKLAAVAGEPPRVDLALLGVGDDGHVASLFPGHPLLAERKATVAAVLDSPKPPPRRLTLTLPTLAGARLVVVAALSAGKAAAMAAALGDPSSELPVAMVLRGARRSLVLLDPSAAP